MGNGKIKYPAKVRVGYALLRVGSIALFFFAAAIVALFALVFALGEFATVYSTPESIAISVAVAPEETMKEPSLIVALFTVPPRETTNLPLFIVAPVTVPEDTSSVPLLIVTPFAEPSL